MIVAKNTSGSCDEDNDNRANVSVISNDIE